MLASIATLVAAVGVASAHFQIEYPTWRADSLNNDSYSQYDFPCAGVPQGVAGDNRTDWPTTGGSLSLDLHHPWTYVFVNLGLGDNVTNFNYSLTPSFWNETGKGVLCIPHLDLPAGLAPTDGQRATIQVVTLGESGSALYNCADITFRNSSVANFGGANCTTDAGVSYTLIGDQANGTSSSGGSGSGTATSSGSAGSASTTTTGKNAGAASGVNKAVLTSVVALAVAFMYGMSA
ncbi:hypothetical protein SPBR_03227 [Sporothrix brasiliensis 5110]|uniref:Copper acquisition factor BIM1-like domain-containing protein n=1 Tax=Sporothrix brasiliensis 5110 TaxID=1398154 RepID=A0A0C2FQA6_9PEZI|nr:uncharacterized protein SPBR_03227 [Sporothrix brasiliensis 5110]KIH93218.1 hypothetical protein SPBR_03227 [Sporothrix brasiliensis 5110]